MFAGLSRLGRLHPQSEPGRHGVERLSDIPYVEGGGREHRLDVYRLAEPTDGPRPAVLYIHGGAFQALSKESHWLMALAFARRGFVVFNINYRLAPSHPFPAALQDACLAAEWVGANAERYGADASRLVVGGDSAGANLASALTIATCWRRPEEWAARMFDTGLHPLAVSAAYGILQVSDSARFGRRRRLPWAIDQRIIDVEDCYLPEGAAGAELADPLLFLETASSPERPLPPFFLSVGTSDPILDDTRRMAAAVARFGVEGEARFYEGEVHGFDSLIWRKNARRCWKHRFEFLDRHMGPAAP